MRKRVWLCVDNSRRRVRNESNVYEAIQQKNYWVLISLSCKEVSGKPVSGKPASGKPVSGKPASGKPVSGKPAIGKPVSGKPAIGKPASGKPARKVGSAQPERVKSKGHIPHYCYKEGSRGVSATCRMCRVEREGGIKPVPSCALPVGVGRRVWTETPIVQKVREGVIERRLINHPLDCPICDQGGECDLQEQSRSCGSDGTRMWEPKRGVEDKEIGGLVRRIITRCIHCTRCVRYSKQVAGVGKRGMTGRGRGTEIGMYTGETRIGSPRSGNRVDRCPVGARTARGRAVEHKGRPWEKVVEEQVNVREGQGEARGVIQVSGRRSPLQVRRKRENGKEWRGDKARRGTDGRYFGRRTGRESTVVAPKLTPFKNSKKVSVNPVKVPASLDSSSEGFLGERVMKSQRIFRGSLLPFVDSSQVENLTLSLQGKLEVYDLKESKGAPKKSPNLAIWIVNSVSVKKVELGLVLSSKFQYRICRLTPSTTVISKLMVGAYRLFKPTKQLSTEVREVLGNGVTGVTGVTGVSADFLSERKQSLLSEKKVKTRNRKTSLACAPSKVKPLFNSARRKVRRGTGVDGELVGTRKAMEEGGRVEIGVRGLGKRVEGRRHGVEGLYKPVRIKKMSPLVDATYVEHAHLTKVKTQEINTGSPVGIEAEVSSLRKLGEFPGLSESKDFLSESKEPSLRRQCGINREAERPSRWMETKRGIADSVTRDFLPESKEQVGAVSDSNNAMTSLGLSGGELEPSLGVGRSDRGKRAEGKKWRSRRRVGSLRSERKSLSRGQTFVAVKQQKKVKTPVRLGAGMWGREDGRGCRLEKGKRGKGVEETQLGHSQGAIPSTIRQHRTNTQGTRVHGFKSR